MEQLQDVASMGAVALSQEAEQASAQHLPWSVVRLQLGTN